MASMILYHAVDDQYAHHVWVLFNSEKKNVSNDLLRVIALMRSFSHKSELSRLYDGMGSNGIED